MKIKNVRVMARCLEGFQTAESMAKKLGVSERTAINYAYELRKCGFLREWRGERGKRIYEISPAKFQKTGGYIGMYETINKYSPIKVEEPFRYVVYGRPLSIEETLAMAIATREFRTILAAVGLFKKVRNWKELYRFAKKYSVQRHVGALYDLSRRYLRTRRMDGRIRGKLMGFRSKSKYIVPMLKGRDFPEIEKEWGVFIPFNKGDMNRYREVKR